MGQHSKTRLFKKYVIVSVFNTTAAGLNLEPSLHVWKVDKCLRRKKILVSSEEFRRGRELKYVKYALFGKPENCLMLLRQFLSFLMHDVTHAKKREKNLCYYQSSKQGMRRTWFLLKRAFFKRHVLRISSPLFLLQWMLVECLKPCSRF